MYAASAVLQTKWRISLLVDKDMMIFDDLTLHVRRSPSQIASTITTFSVSL